MEHGVFTSKASDAQREVLDDGARCLPVNEVAVGKRVLEHGDYRVAVICRLRPDVFEYERQSLQATGPNIQLGSAIFIQNCRNASEGYEERVISTPITGKVQKSNSRPQVSATIAIATVLHTRLCRSWTLKLVKRTESTS